MKQIAERQGGRLQMSTDTNTVLKSVDAQAALVTDEYNIRYISGFTGG